MKWWLLIFINPFMTIKNTLPPVIVLYKFDWGFSCTKFSVLNNDLAHLKYLYEKEYNLLKFLTDDPKKMIQREDFKGNITHKQLLLNQINNTYYKYINLDNKVDAGFHLLFDKSIFKQLTLKEFFNQKKHRPDLYKINYMKDDNEKPDDELLYGIEGEIGLEIKILLSQWSALIYQNNVSMEKNNNFHNSYGVYWGHRFLIQMPIKTIYGFLGFQWDWLLFSWDKKMQWGNKSYYYQKKNKDKTKDFDMLEGFRWTWILGLQFNKKKWLFYDYRWLLKFSIYISYQEIAYWTGTLLGFQWGQYRGYNNLRPQSISLGLNCSL